MKQRETAILLRLLAMVLFALDMPTSNLNDFGISHMVIHSSSHR